ncbi:STM4015 family protein [Nocardiopsis sp. NRRL B-16309]|uniref:STM4015 family protein n=1 Tax=Nocardiopsis sp. NRRL B-16309 TaxID=1519494 RepID=UPI0006AE359E|nr:STM4015 family protein [Nocardiopsis sp. NRRL B-16309]KOX16003.1 hypothetical protein ADL05_13530 [Nocardiopsis sp. NRRL B-16309]
MLHHQHISEFAGLPVVEFPGLDTLDHAPPNPVQPHAVLAAALEDPGSVAWRLRMEEPDEEPREDLPAYLERFVREVPPHTVRALIVGHVPDDYQFMSDEARDQVAGLASRLTNLRSLFFAEVVSEESEISWIEHGDLTPLLAAYPRLTGFTVRGTDGLGLGVGRHEHLRRLTVQTGGLPGQVARDVAAADLPALERLELWLGQEEYGNDTTPEDLAAVLSGDAFPRLRHLGLRNAENADDWARVVAEAPVVFRLDVLDLSLGSLTDEGAELLLAAPALHGLQRLDLHHHYLSEETAERLRTEFTKAGVETDVSDRREPHVFEGSGGVVVSRFPAVGE